MKKVLSFVLVLSMILGSFGMAFAAPATDTVGLDCEDAANVLTELGVIGGYKDGTFRPGNIVTRAEMATMIVKALGLNDYAVGTSSFKDMAGHWADAYVAYAVSLGFIAGYSDNTFRPDEPVTADQAITMVVQALGYKGEYLTGGYPGAFVTQALTLGMLDDVKSGKEGMDRGSVAILLFNTLNETFVRYDNEGKLDNVTLSGGANDTMLRRLGASEFDGGNGVGKAFVVTGNEKTVINLNEYEGAYVKAYQNSSSKIIAVEEVISVFVTGDIEADGDGTYTFVTTDDVEYKMDRVDTKAVAYFENGDYDENNTKVITALTGGDEKNVVLAVELSGNYIDALYSISVWKNAKTVQADEDLLEELAEDDVLNNDKFVMTDDDEIDMDKIVLLGVDALADIEEDDVITYYTDSSAKVVRVEVGTEVVEGKITKINAAGDEVTINAKKYDVIGTLFKGTEKIELGGEGKYFLNYAGDIAGFTGVVEAKDYAVVTKAMAEDNANAGAYEASSTKPVKVKLLTADGTETVYVVEEDYAKTVAKSDFVEEKIVVFSLDKNGEIDMINLVSKEADTTVESATGKVLSAKGTLDGNDVAESVVVFTIDDTDPADVDFAVGKLADIKVDEKLIDADSKFFITEDEVVVIVLGDDDMDAASVYGVVAESGKIKNEDNKTVWEVKLLIDGAEVTYLTTSESVAVPAAGGLLQKLDFDGGDIKLFTAETIDEGTAGWAVTASAINSKGNIKIAGDYVEIASDVVVYLYDAKDDKISIAEFDDISEGDYVTFYELDGAKDENGVDVIIYKEK